MTVINGGYREFKLDNGLSVALQETPTQTVSGRLRVWHGALNEREGEEGIAHFLEHTLMTGGSKKYEPEKADDIRETFGSFNAYTTPDRTSFPIDMIGEDTPLYLDYVADAVFHPRFEANKVEEERQRVLRETADRKSSPTFKDTNTFREAFFGKDSPNNYLVLGKEEVVNSASIDTLRNFHARGYHPNNMDLILVGALPENIEDLIQQNFGQFQPGKGKRFEFPRNPKINGSTVLHTYAPELYNQDNPSQSSASLSIGLFGPTQTDEDSYATDMLVDILGGAGNSRLFANVSQKRGLAYGISAKSDGSNNSGTIFIGGNIPSARANEAIDAVFDEMGKLRTDLVSTDTLEKLIRRSRYGIAKLFEVNAGHANAIELKMDKELTPEYILEQMGRVTPERIREAAIRYFPRSRENGDYVLMLRDPLKK